MERKRKNALEILHKRYIEGDSERKVELQEERVNAEVARLIYDLRKNAGLNQKELGELVGTTQSVISRLEDSDYEGHSFSMLDRIAKALNKRIKVSYVLDEPKLENIKHIFQIVIKKLRLKHNLTVEELARKLDVGKNDILELELNSDYRPAPLILYKLSNFFDIPQSSLNLLAGATKEIPPDFTEEASRFAAQSDSFEKLTSEERKILDSFVLFLKKAFQGD